MELLWFGEEESRGREQFDEMHEPMSARALPQHGLCDGWCFGGKRLIEQGAAERQHVGSSAVGEEAEVADTRKASRQDMLYEAAQELFRGKCHGALPAAVGIVLPAEADLGS